MTEVSTVVLADDHPFMAQGVAEYIGGQDDFQVVGIADNRDSLLAILADKQPVKAGANGYIMKTKAPKQILAALRAVRDEGHYLSARMMGTLDGAVPADLPQLPEGVSLSNKELDILFLIGIGLSNREIADKRCLSIKTVESHCDNLKLKRDISSMDGLRDFAKSWLRDVL